MARFTHRPAPDVQRDMSDLVGILEFDHIDPDRVHCRRSQGSTADIYARIWELPGMWQKALDVPPQYVIEVLAEHYDVLPRDEQLKIVIHELLHIPKTFSGAVRNHSGQGEKIDGHSVNRYFRRYQKAIREREARKGREAEGQLVLPL
jgi:predicted metallopeptidase